MVNNYRRGKVKSPYASNIDGAVRFGFWQGIFNYASVRQEKSETASQINGKHTIMCVNRAGYYKACYNFTLPTPRRGLIAKYDVADFSIG